jgi:hypothetical protein
VNQRVSLFRSPLPHPNRYAIDLPGRCACDLCRPQPDEYS